MALFYGRDEFATRADLIAGLARQRLNQSTLDYDVARRELIAAADAYAAARGMTPLHRPGEKATSHLSPRAAEAAPHATYRDLAKAAHTVAIYVAAAHKEGWILGDLKPANIMASRDLQAVTLIDCDSWRHPNAPANWAPRLGGERMPPEFAAKTVAAADQITDAYQLGFTIFETLMLGFQPFPKDDGHFTRFKLPPGAPPLDLLPRPIQILCERAFGPRDHRPTAQEWIGPLEAML